MHRTHSDELLGDTWQWELDEDDAREIEPLLEDLASVIAESA